MRDVPQQRVNANGSRRLARRYLEILWLQEIDEVDSMNALHAIRGQLAALITALSTAVLANGIGEYLGANLAWWRDLYLAPVSLELR